MTKATAFLFLITLSLPSLWAQQPAFHTEMFHGRHAYVLDNGAVVYSGPARELAADQARIEALAGASAKDWTHA